MPFEVHFSSSWADRVRRGDVDYDASRTDPDLAAHVMVTRERGVALVGPPAKRVFGEVLWRDYIASIKDDFDWIVDDDNLLTTPFYGVLNAARVCMVLEQGEGCVPSKDEAGEWALKQFPASEQDIVRQALACYRDGGPVKDADRQVHGHAWAGAQLRSFRDYVKGRALDDLLDAEERGLEGSPWDQEVVREARRAVDARGLEALAVDDLEEGDLDDIPWSGSSTHIDHVRRALQRVPPGEVEYLAVRTPSRAPIAKGGIDYAERADGGTLWQLATHPDLQGLGIGTRLIRAAEDRIRRRGLPYAYLGVEDGNAPARRLYERLGYKEVGREPDSWDQEDEHGDVYRYETEVVILRKELKTGDL